MPRTLQRRVMLFNDCTALPGASSPSPLSAGLRCSPTRSGRAVRRSSSARAPAHARRVRDEVGWSHAGLARAHRQLSFMQGRYLPVRGLSVDGHDFGGNRSTTHDSISIHAVVVNNVSGGLTRPLSHQNDLVRFKFDCCSKRREGLGTHSLAPSIAPRALQLDEVAIDERANLPGVQRIARATTSGSITEFVVTRARIRARLWLARMASCGSPPAHARCFHVLATPDGEVNLTRGGSRASGMPGVWGNDSQHGITLPAVPPKRLAVDRP